MSETKRIAQIILPKQDNDGKSLTWAHDIYQKAFCSAFGGFTAYDVRGGWMNDKGILYQDESVSYHIAMDDTFANAEKLRGLAKAAALECRQECIFIVLPSGDVEFITA